LGTHGGSIHAMAHITGGGLTENIIRVIPEGLGLDIEASAIVLPPVFDWLQREGAVADEEMWRTFNCGVGFVLVVPQEAVATVGAALEAQGLAHRAIGRVVARSGDDGRVRIGGGQAMALLPGRRPRLAVLVSGRGSNLQAVLDAIAGGQLDAEVVGVFSDRPDAAALARVAPELRWSRKARAYPDRAAFDADLGDAIAACNPDWIFCAGYMRILGDAFVRRFEGRLLNVHPSLLPMYKGLHTHARALEAGDAEHGASVHFVVPELDAGAVIAQVRIPVL